MRLQRGTLVAGLDPQLARDLAKACRGGQTLDVVARRVNKSPEDTRHALLALLDGEFVTLESKGVALDFAGVEYWKVTIRGAALAMAKFLRPISRAKAVALLDLVVDRASEYNARPDTPYVVAEVRVFGSYLDSAAALLGDLDVALVLEEREEGSSAWGPDYTYRSGRRFASFVDELAWPRAEPALACRAGSPYINVHLEDVTRFTDRWAIVYTRGQGRLPLQVA